MKIRNIFKEQLLYPEVIYIQKNEKLFNNLFKYFINKENFFKNIKNITDNINIDDIISTHTKITKQIKDIEDKLKILYKQVQNLELYLVILDYSYDGHSLYINNKYAAFLDINILSIREKNKNFNLKMNILHELIHTIHYNLNKEFAYDKIKIEQNFKRKIFKWIYSEGLATYLSGKLIKGDAFSFGLEKKEKIEEWKNNAEEYKNRVNKLIQAKDKNLINKLFFFNKDITEGRFGYFYGYNILKNLSKEFTDNQLLSLDYTHLHNYIQDFFY